MPLQKIVLKPGVNRENTRYTNEGGYYESNLVRFRQGTPEKIGGWAQISPNTFTGICRSLWNWTTLAGANLVGVGTEEKFFISQRTNNSTDNYYDITPIVSTGLLASGPLTVTGGSNIVTVTDATYHPYVGDYVIFTGMTAFQDITLNGQYRVVSLPSSTTYTVASSTNASGTEGTVYTGGGGSVAYAAYLLNVGNTVTNATTAWGSGNWDAGNWSGTTSTVTNTGTKLWTQYNFGENLLFGAKQGAMYMWNATTATTLATPTTVTISDGTPALVTLTSNTTVPLVDGTALMFETTGALPLPLKPFTVYYVITPNLLIPSTTFNLSLTSGGAAINTTTAGSGDQTISIRAIPVSALPGASDVPLTQNTLIVSDASDFTFVFGSNAYLSTTYDPMLVRWSDQESLTNWTPAVTNQSGSLRLSHGSQIQAVLQARQEILVFTDAAVYSLQYLGAPYVWGSQILSDNISIVSINAAMFANGTAFWMGQDKFYKYDGRVQTLNCDLLRFIFDDINRDQYGQIFAGTNEGFNEVWWFYCTKNSDVINRYVVYNYIENAWYYGSLGRTAWLDSSLRSSPMAATYANNLVYHENGVDDNTTGTAVAINAWITTSQFDIGDGHNFAFAWRMLPDLTFVGSTAGTAPSLTMQLQPLQNSGSGYNDPISVGGTSATGTQTVTSTTQVYPIDVDTFTGQLNIRVRGRQMSMRIESNQIGTQWQLGAPRVDFRPDGRRGG
jgi:hypothetical protein